MAHKNLANDHLLSPDFEKAYWRSVRRLRYRDQEGFSKKKGHFEPEDHNAFANRWAEELTREASSSEIRQIYENAVVILGNRRSEMDRGDQSLDCNQFRFTIQAIQDPEDPAQILQTRSLWIKIALNRLPAHFDDLFPYRPNELVVPFKSQCDRREILVTLEDWEANLKAKLRESADQNILSLDLPSGFTMTVDLTAQETIFSKIHTEGVCALGPAIAQDLKSLKITKQLI
jgi:hypothetical protein